MLSDRDQRVQIAFVSPGPQRCNLEDRVSSVARSGSVEVYNIEQNKLSNVNAPLHGFVLCKPIYRLLLATAVPRIYVSGVSATVREA